MKLYEILRIVDGTLVNPGPGPELEISCACGADLMSDVLAFGQAGSLLLTGLTNPQVVRTVEMAGMAAIVFVWGKKPPAETIALAQEKGIPLIVAPHALFDLCGRLHGKGMKGCHP
jgi:hypothetical protein